MSRLQLIVGAVALAVVVLLLVIVDAGFRDMKAQHEEYGRDGDGAVTTPEESAAAPLQPVTTDARAFVGGEPPGDSSRGQSDAQTMNPALPQHEVVDLGPPLDALAPPLQPEPKSVVDLGPDIDADAPTGVLEKM